MYSYFTLIVDKVLQTVFLFGVLKYTRPFDSQVNYYVQRVYTHTYDSQVNCDIQRVRGLKFGF